MENYVLLHQNTLFVMTFCRQHTIYLLQDPIRAYFPSPLCGQEPDMTYIFALAKRYRFCPQCMGIIFRYFPTSFFPLLNLSFFFSAILLRTQSTPTEKVTLEHYQTTNNILQRQET